VPAHPKPIPTRPVRTRPARTSRRPKLAAIHTSRRFPLPPAPTTIDLVAISPRSGKRSRRTPRQLKPGPRGAGEHQRSRRAQAGRMGDLRSDSNGADFARYAAFITAISWPSMGSLRRRAEAMLWTEHSNPRPCSRSLPRSAPFGKGKFLLARTCWSKVIAAAGRRRCATPGGTRPSVRPRRPGARHLQGVITPPTTRRAWTCAFMGEDADGALARRARRRHAPTSPRRASPSSRRPQMPRRCSMRCQRRRDAIARYVSATPQWLRRADKGAQAGELILSLSRDTGVHARFRSMVDRASALSPASFSTSATPSPPIRIARERGGATKDNYRIEHAVHRRMDRAALPQRSDDGADHFAAHRAGNHQSDLARARRLLQGRAAEAMGRNDGGARAIMRSQPSTPPPITARSPAPTSATRTWGWRPADPPGGVTRSRGARWNCSKRDRRARTSQPERWPILATAGRMPPRCGHRRG